MCCSDCLALSMIRPLGVLIMTGLRCLSEASWYAGGVWSLRGCLFCKKNLALDAWKKAGLGIGCGYGYVAATLLHRLSRLSSYLGGCGNYQGLVG